MYISQLWLFFGALISSNTLDLRNTRCTDVTIRASLKSEVSLPCHFNISHYNKTEEIKWSHHYSLVTIKNNGIIYFHSPSEGRVSSFPNLAKGGNFSILIHDLQSSDIGTYFCELNSECWRVKIMELPEKTEKLNSNHNSWFYFFAGAGIFTLLFCIFNRIGLQNRLQSSTEKCMRSSKSSSANEERQEEHGSSSQTSNIKQRAFRTPDPNDFTTSTIYYVVQA
ncbi:uncharacterized protein LOC128029325 [Carassius gibelio]|uniref:uncharacterized protein LOC128029325 n=1 Tax=Carassius gibelio TaxID=101364 RepID=UPI0022797590|nr:uncharacterized protein LOC128029325 [Carassius gibelio]